VHSTNNYSKYFTVSVDNAAITNDKSAISLITMYEERTYTQVICTVRRTQVYTHFPQPAFILEGLKGEC
jgi:hypothetical protein